MRYILSNHIALRSWQLVPYAYYIKGERNAKGLKADEFVFLSSCDGKERAAVLRGKFAGPPVSR